MTLTTTLNGTDSMAGVHASLHNAENAAINTLTSGLALAAPLASPALTGTPTAPTAAPGTNTQQIATTAFAAAAIASLVASAPTTLDTLSELATALGNDPNLATTLTNLIALKAPIATTVTLTSAQTLTNKTIDASANTLTGVVTLTGTQTLTNKTLTAPHLTGPVVDSGGLTVTAGNVGIGITPALTVGLYIPTTLTLTGGTTQWGLISSATGDSGATASIFGIESNPQTAAAAFTVGKVAGFHAVNPGKGAGSTITSAYGLLVDPITSGNGSNYGIYVGAPSGASGANVGIYNAGVTNLRAGVIVAGAAPATTASEFAFGGVFASTATTGTLGAPPAQVVGYLTCNTNGTVVKIPLYNA